ncbi:imidazolonepropionase [Saccharicrinis sp. FJH62]|uniref:imidazolonepropionase n=1 Tax=Saccharicrinis sp. FJH62 TaxID=3344657 RepID=UPI0035D47133
MKLTGPFRQIITMDKLPVKGPLNDDQLEIIPDGGILSDKGKIIAIGDFTELAAQIDRSTTEIEWIHGNHVALPGLIDCHTHICYAGSRANDFALRLAGKTYLEIAEAGGGIWNTVQKTREASQEELSRITTKHADVMLKDGITTIEVKSGYGLSVDQELKILKAIQSSDTKADLLATCLAAHIRPKDFSGSNEAYLKVLAKELLPEIKNQELSQRVDIFIEKTAFSADEARSYLNAAKDLGFDIVVHGDQFSLGGSLLAVDLNARSVDHLEASDDKVISMIGKSEVSATVLPGASIGLGLPFAPARKLLNAGASLAIASDWNPGSAPMGDLLIQASILSSYEKLSVTETLAGITCRAAHALGLDDRGILKEGNKADIIAFSINDYREIIYRQGKLKPDFVWKNGNKLTFEN